MLARVPIRLRLTAAFALVMAIVLASTGLFLYFRFQSELDRTLNTGLRSRGQDVAALVRQSDAVLSAGRPTKLLDEEEAPRSIVRLGELGLDEALQPALAADREAAGLFSRLRELDARYELEVPVWRLGLTVLARRLGPAPSSEPGLRCP